jgi:hypothetical protein
LMQDGVRIITGVFRQIRKIASHTCRTGSR